MNKFLEIYIETEIIIEIVSILLLIAFYLGICIRNYIFRKKKKTMITKIVTYNRPCNLELVKPCEPFDPETLPILPKEVWNKILEYKYNLNKEENESRLYTMRWNSGWRPKNWSYTAQIGGDWIVEKNK